MKKLKSSFKNMVLVLACITIVAALALGWVNELTSEPIRLAAIAKQEQAIRMVSPGFDNEPVQEQYELTDYEGNILTCFPIKKQGKLLGVAIETFSMKGFNGEVRLMLGLKPDGIINNYEVLKQTETPGLGTQMTYWFKTDKNNQSILNKDPGKEKVWVAKDGGDIDAITAATITSRAFLDAVDRAYRAYMEHSGNVVDVVTTATIEEKEAQNEEE
jgi:electron transport complex protein RnfG